MALLLRPCLDEARLMCLTWSLLCLVIHADCLWLVAAKKTARISSSTMFVVLGCL